MNRSPIALLLICGVLALPNDAGAQTVESRFVERVGNTDTPIGGYLDLFPWYAHRYRLQLRVVDDQNGPAAAGGIYGWRGSIDQYHFLGARTPGRLPNFTFPADSGNGVPLQDPFFDLTQIDSSRGPQTIAWTCSGGVIPPMPQPVIRGRNTYVSVWETTGRFSHCGSASMTYSGVVLVATSWRVEGTPVPPVCDPPTPGSVTYVPTNIVAVPFQGLAWGDWGPPPQPPPEYWACTADWNFDNELDSRDFFGFITDFFNGYADADCNDTTDSADFFWFLRLFLSDCHP